MAQTQVLWHMLEVLLSEKEPVRLGKEPSPLRGVDVMEPDPPAGVEPVEWLLLTSLPATTSAEAMEVLTFYSLHWRIEDWHRFSRVGVRWRRSPRAPPS